MSARTIATTATTAGALLVIAAAACSVKSDPAPAADDAGAVEAGAPPLGSSDQPIANLTPDQLARFNQGDQLFNLSYRAPDGLGPLYIRTSCSSCHAEVARGPGLVQKMAVVLGDGFTPAPDQSKLKFGLTVVPLVVAPAMTPIVPPPGDSSVKVTIRIGPPVMGHGYMEAVADSEMVDGMITIGSTEGVSAAPEGGAALAALRHLLERGVIKRDESVVLFNTGGALKYLDALPRA